MKPLLKWPGGKRWLVSHLKPYYEAYAQQAGVQYARLVEPFAGGAAIALGLEPVWCLLNDLNAPLMNFYYWVANGLLDDVDPSSLPGTEEEYLSTRSQFNALKDNAVLRKTPIVAQLLYSLNRTCFNGLWRVNSKGKFNVPWGRYKNPSTKSFAPYAALMQRWGISNLDFRALCTFETDFIYADPPYDEGFTKYVAGGFTWEDQVSTAMQWCYHPGPVFLSNRATQRIIELYGDLDYELNYFEAPRHIAANANSRQPVKEVLAIRNKPEGVT